jgi:hypothetical protein
VEGGGGDPAVRHPEEEGGPTAIGPEHDDAGSSGAGHGN